MRGARITGWGSDLPEKVLTNDDLARMMDTNDEWIRDRTGISSRRVGGSTVGMAVNSGRHALERAGVDPADIDLVVLATTSPDQMIPASSAAVQAELGLQCGAVDMNAACSGFVYALVTGYLYVGAGLDRVLVIGSDAMSAWTDYEDRGTAILFGDGAGAVVLEATDADDAGDTDGTDGEGTLLGWDLGADGTTRHILYADHGDKMKMDGKEVFRQAVRAMTGSSERAMAKAGVTIEDIAWVIPHQANIRIVESAAQKLRCPRERLVTVLEHTGNTSSGSIPLALVAAVDDGRIQPGDLLLLTGFGAGMTWASAIVRWQP